MRVKRLRKWFVMMFRIAAKKLRGEDPTGLKFHPTATTNNVDEAINFAVCLAATASGAGSGAVGAPLAQLTDWESMGIGR